MTVRNLQSNGKNCITYKMNDLRYKFEVKFM